MSGECNKFDLWAEGARMSNVALAKELGVSPESVRLWRLPFGDDARTTPRQGVMGKIIALAAGALTPSDFYSAAASEGSL